MKIPDKILWAVFLAALLSPILALMVKPSGYSFYMFLPATPHMAIDRFRSVTGDIILVTGFAIAVLVAVALAWRGLRRKRYLTLLCPIVVLANPFQQPIVFESLDTHMNYRWRNRAEQLMIVGKTPDEVRNVFGRPSYVWTETPKTLDSDGKVTSQGETYTGWDYHVLPFYWMGSKFQVFFVDGKVRNFEANDD